MSFTPHVTVATLVEKEGKFLVVREQVEGRTVYNQPAGHLEEGETLQEAAIRETLEETGWEVLLTDFLGVSTYRSPHNGETYIRHTFIAMAIRHHPDAPLDEDIEAAEWLSYEQILELGNKLRSPVVRRVVQEYRNGKRFPLEMVQNHL